MLRRQAAFTATWLVVLIVGVITYYQLRNQPFLLDANGYVLAARSIAHKGLLNDWYLSDIRSYGFPLFLNAAFKVSQWLHVGPNTGVFALQWPIYVGSAWLAATSLFRSDRTRLIGFAMLAANPLMVVYTAQAFTESLSVSCVLLAVAALGRAAHAGLRVSAAAWLAVGAAASSYAMAVRPGNVLIPACYALAAGGVLRGTKDCRRWAAKAATAMLVLAALVAPLVPQVLINQYNYQRPTPLPVTDLAAVQASAGLLLIRYATNVSVDCGDARLFFLNPDKPSLDVTTAEALRYYTLSWPEGPETAVLHVFSGLDPRPFLTDQHDFGARYERWLQAFTLGLLFLACAGALEAFAGLRVTGWRCRMDVVFLGVVTLLAVGILATSGAEYRFGVLPLLTVSLLAAMRMARPRRPTRQVVVLLAGGYLGGLLLWFTLSDLVLATSGTWRNCS